MGMGMVYGGALWLIVLGALGASSLIISKKPNARELFAKVAPYQGWFGVVSALWGAWGVISALLNLGILGWGMGGVLLWATAMGTSVVQLLLGFLLGFGVARGFVKNEQAAAKMDQTLKKLAPWQGTLGIIAITAGLWYIVFAVVLLPGMMMGMMTKAAGF